MTHLDFTTCEASYARDNLAHLYQSELGMRYLLLRSLSRKSQMIALGEDTNVDLSGVPTRSMLRTLFDSPATNDAIRRTIRRLYAIERAERISHEQQLVAELYKMTSFDWGGLHQNSLDRTIINNYVKKIRSFDIINDKINQDLMSSLRGYTQCSWYNHWTSILIEDIFKDHPNVLPTVGLIKKIDFFIDGVPYDLKVTHLPEGYIKLARKKSGEKAEITELQRVARQLNLVFDGELPETKRIEHIWRMLADHPDERARTLISDLRAFRSQVLQECMEDPTELIVWLYEFQGERRFDASNRLFLVLVDDADYFSSWKLKRAHSLLVDQIHEYLDSARADDARAITFTWQESQYTAFSDTLFVVRAT